MLRLRRAQDVPAIARASHAPETRRWLDDPPMGPDEERTALARAEERWRSGRGAPFVIADAATDAALVLRGHCTTHGRRHDCVMFSLVPDDLA